MFISAKAIVWGWDRELRRPWPFVVFLGQGYLIKRSFINHLNSGIRSYTTDGWDYKANDVVYITLYVLAMTQSNVTLYAYLNITNPMVAWEVAIGRIRSACDTTREQFGVSVWSYSLLRKFSIEGANRRFINELLLESVRQRAHPQAVSRLAGIYFFESESDAHSALDRWRMPERKPFISEVSFSANNLTRVDSEWITSYLGSEERNWM